MVLEILSTITLFEFYFRNWKLPGYRFGWSKFQSIADHIRTREKGQNGLENLRLSR